MLRGVNWGGGGGAPSSFWLTRQGASDPCSDCSLVSDGPLAVGLLLWVVIITVCEVA